MNTLNALNASLPSTAASFVKDLHKNNFEFLLKRKLLILLTVFAFCINVDSQNLNGIISTFAGNGTGGWSGDGGQASIAELNGPADVAFDAAGNMYIADQINNLIRKVSPSGIITTVAGGGTSGLGDGGPATAAQLAAPTGVTLDAFGNIYIADQYTYRIRMVNTLGIITTVAGNGSPTYAGDGGQATNASLYNPTAVAFDASGNFYIADYSNNRIRMVNIASGIITTFAGNGTQAFGGDGGQATNAEFSGPVGIAFDASGNLYIADRNNNRIRIVNPSGIINTFAGNGTAGYTGNGGQANAAEFNGPFGLDIDGTGNLYISDLYNNVVRIINPSGIINTIAGNGTQGYSGDGGPATAAELYFPAETALGVNASGNLFIADYGNNRVRMVVPGTITSSSSCATSYTINTPSGPASGTLAVQQGTATLASSQGWFAIYATTPTLSINVSFSANSNLWQVKNMSLLNGTCGSYTIAGADSLTSASDSVLQITATNLTPGALYYLDLTEGSYTACVSCQKQNILNYVINYTSIGQVAIEGLQMYGNSCGPIYGGICNSLAPTNIACTLTVCVGTSVTFAINFTDQWYQYPYSVSYGATVIGGGSYTNVTDFTDPDYQMVPPGLIPYTGPYPPTVANVNLVQVNAITFNAPGTYYVQGSFSGGNTLDCIGDGPPYPLCWLDQCTQVVEIIVVANPLNATFSVPTSVCYGDDVCITQTNPPTVPYTYTASIGGTNLTGSSTGGPVNNLCFPGLSVGTYPTNLTYYDASCCTLEPGYGCTATDNTWVNVNQLEANITPTINCDVVTFLATPVFCVDANATYSWNFGDPTSTSNTATGNPVTHVYSSPGSYIATLTITNPSSGAPTTFNVNVTTTSNCCGVNVRSGTGPLGPRTAYSIGNSGPYQAGVNPYGYVVNNGNENSSLTISNEDYTVWGAPPGGHPASSIYIYSPSNFGVNSIVTFENCTFLMYPGSSIVIYTQTTGTSSHNEASTLTVNFNNCHLYGCKELWNGISFQHANFPPILYGNPEDQSEGMYNFTTNLNINNTLLEDAYIGVDNTGIELNSTYVTDNLKFTTTHSMYNKNYIDLNLDNAKLSSSSFSNNSVYTCRTVPYDPPFNELPVTTTNAGYYTNLSSYSPTYIKPSSLHGISSTTSLPYEGANLFFTYLIPTTPWPQTFDLSTNTNIFDTHTYGIVNGLAYPAVDLKIGKQYFYNMPGGGTGIYSVGGSGRPTINIGTSATGANYFTNCGIGIHHFGAATSFNASGNVINTCGTGIGVNYFGNATTNPNCVIDNNNIQNITYNGINFNMNSSINAQAENNTISNTSTNLNLTSTGISVNEIGSTTASYIINSNGVTNLFNGITANGTYGAQINNNTIQLYSPASYPPLTYNYGISDINSTKDYISNNIITGNNALYSYGQYGINAADAPNSQYYCNQITGTNVGFNFQGPMPCYVLDNNIYNQTIDVWMLNSCVIGTQYNPAYLIYNFILFGFIHIFEAQPADNAFTGTALYSSYCSNTTNGNLSPFYIRNTAPYTMPLNGFQLASFSVPMTPQYPTPWAPPTNVNCTACTSCRQIKLARQIALDSLFAPTDVRNTVVSRQALFANLMLENISTTGDTVLTNFKTNAAATNTGKLLSISTNISTGIAQSNPAMLTTAKQTNSALMPANIVETYQQEVNTIYLNFLDSGFTFSPADLSTLRQIAALCPFTDGTAVWQARAMLAGVDNTKYMNACEIVTPPSSDARVAHSENTDVDMQSAKTAIYPNPNSGSFTVSYIGGGNQLTIEIYSTLGQQIVNKQFNVADAANIPITGFEDGVYMVKLSVDGIPLRIERVIVTK
jgi:hypothetical protein